MTAALVTLYILGLVALVIRVCWERWDERKREKGREEFRRYIRRKYGKQYHPGNPGDR